MDNSSSTDGANRILTGKIEYHEGPSFQSNVAGKIGLTPVIPIVHRGAKSLIEHQHLWKLRKTLASRSGWDEFEPYWNQQLGFGDPSLILAMWNTWKWKLSVAGLMQVVFAATQFGLPVLMPYIVDWFIFAPLLPLWWVFIYSIAIYAAIMCGALYNYHSVLYTYELGLRVRAALITLIYRKALYTPLDRTQTSGMIVNMVSTDSQFLLENIPLSLPGLVAPIQIAATMGLMSRLIGPYCLIPLAGILLIMVVSGVITMRVNYQTAQVQKRGDFRLKLIREFLSAVRIVKYYAWENPFLANIFQARRRQIRMVRGLLLSNAVILALFINAPVLFISLTFVFYSIKHTVNYQVIFSTLVYLNMLYMPFLLLPLLISFMAQYYASLSRIKFYALRTELEPRITSTSPHIANPDMDDLTNAVIIQGNASFAWETQISIAESRFLDLENKEAEQTQTLNAAQTKEEQKAASEALDQTSSEKLWLSKLVPQLQRVEKIKKRFAQSSRNVLEDLAELPQVSFAHPENATFEPLKDPAINLKDINIHIKPNQLTAIVGTVGSGKSTLVNSILGEVRCLQGTVDVYGEVAYAPQEAWILNASVRDNIIFGSPYDPERYAFVVGSCALANDFASFPASDMTELGERGINLSGGQRQRINVARALYSEHPIMILDDPLSAVDAHVGDHMFQHVAKYCSRHGRTVILVMNQLNFVKEVDHIIVMKRGRIAEQGSYHQLISLNGVLAKMLRRQQQEQQQQGEQSFASTRNLKMSTELGQLSSTQISTLVLSGSSNLTVKAECEHNNVTQFIPSESQDAEMVKTGALMQAEEREEGNIGLQTYWNYLKNGNLLIFGIVIVFQVLLNSFSTMSGIWLTWWTDPKNTHHISYGGYLGGYVGINIGAGIFTLLASGTFVFFSVRAGRRLHDKLAMNVAHAPTAWFDRTPLGRVVTRFSKDISRIDVELPIHCDQTLHYFFGLLGMFASVAVGTAYILIILAVCMLGLGALTLHYRKTSVQVQRLESLTRAPILSHFSETLEGAASIRCFRKSKAFSVANSNKIDANNVDYMGLKYCSVWFALTLDMLGSVSVLLSFIAMILVRKFSTSANIGYLIFAVTSTAGIPSLIAAMSNMITDLENKMTSVERVMQYTKVESEASYTIPATSPEESWPSSGSIDIRDLSIEYKAGIPVLHHVTASIKPGEKIGIVGRTGAGKSTLITALFRTVEPVTGSVTIDGVDISSLGLFELRSKLSIIPQVPTLFVGTVRYNLDPFQLYQDDDIWRVLKMVKLKKYISSLDGQLNAVVDENGSNFSVGQRQLIAMARCLLRKTNILLLDEATASVDTDTDCLLQSMIRKHLGGITILTIAHRLNTIMDNDRIMVLDKGHLVEFDTPANLMKHKHGLFTSLVEATGPETAEHLRSIAKAHLNATENNSQ